MKRERESERWFYVYAACLAVGFAACAGSAQVATYQADGLACVDKSATRPEADACRCEVEKRYARPLVHCVRAAADAGAP